MHRHLKAVIIPLTLLLPLSCNLFSQPPTQIATSTPPETIAAQSPIPSPSPALLTPTGTPAPILPTDTPTPLPPTSTPAPISLNAAGPYVLFKGENGIWISNPDGSFLTQVFAGENHTDLRNALSPSGGRLAVVITTDQGLDLVLVNLPSGEVQTITNLISITRDEEINDPLSPKAFATYAIRDYDNLAWQPGDGRLLAFTGAINGPTSDLYLYDTQTQEITQLTDGPSQAIAPIWSPDGQYILHFGVSWVPPFGGAIGGANQLDGAWAVRASDGSLITMPMPDGTNPNFVGWQDSSHYITYDSNDECYAQNLHSVDVTSGETTPIMDNSFYYEISLSPENGALLFSSAPGCSSSLGEGVFLLFPGQSTPGLLLEKRAWEIYWLPESNVFFAYPEALLSSDGTTRYDPPVYDASYEPAVSKEGWQAWEVIQNQVGRVVIKATTGDWQTIMNGFVAGMVWDPADGRTLLIALQDGSLYAATYPDFSPRLMGSLGENVSQIIWSP